jgi:Spy/CpxP family protein refolding chaperone
MKTTITVMMAILFACHISMAQNPEQKGERYNLVKELQLNPDQEAAYKKLQETKHANIKDLRQKITEQQKSLDAAIVEKDASKDLIYEQIDIIGGLKAQVQKERVNFMFGMKDVLTTEQYEVFLEKKKEQNTAVREKQKEKQQKPYRKSKN